MMDDKALEARAYRTFPESDDRAQRCLAALREVAVEARREALEQVAERDVALDKAVLRVAELELERQALLVVWQDGPSLPDCHACAVLGAALRGPGEKT